MSSKKAAAFKNSSPEKEGYMEYCFFGKLDFSKSSCIEREPLSSFSEKVDAVQKWLLQKSSSSIDIFILEKFLHQKVAAPKK